VGGGSHPRPGEISLSNNGVLFLDELTEFRRTTLEVLRQPLEAGRVLIARANMTVEFPASFLLVAALNPCPCGFFGDQSRQCSCTPKQIAAYFGKLSGPLLDRIDVQVHVSSIAYEELKNVDSPHEASVAMRERVERAVEAQRHRQGIVANADLPADMIANVCLTTEAAEYVLKRAFEKLNLSMRGYHKILKIARTIADLDGAEVIDKHHMQQAIMHRSLDRHIEHA
jgi:magnesium chelatase family protein